MVWNSECRHMLGVVLRELEGATPGLQDVPAIEVHEVLYAHVARSSLSAGVVGVCCCVAGCWFLVDQFPWS